MSEKDHEGIASAGGDGQAARLAAAVRKNRVFLAAVVIPVCLLLVMVTAYFAPDWSARAKGSALGLFFVFLLVSALETILMPRFFVAYAAREYRSAGTGDDVTFTGTDDAEARFANLYAVAVLGGTTPCVLGLVIFFFTRNLWEGLVLFAAGLASVAYHSLRTEAVISRALKGGRDFLPFDFSVSSSSDGD